MRSAEKSICGPASSPGAAATVAFREESRPETSQLNSVASSTGVGTLGVVRIRVNEILQLGAQRSSLAVRRTLQSTFRVSSAGSLGLGALAGA